MVLTFTPRKLKGTLRAQPSKSQAQRLIICAALSEGKSSIGNMGDSQDVWAALRAVCQLGLASFEKQGNTLRLSGGGGVGVGPANCGESGAVLRLLMPLTWRGQTTIFTGSEGLLNRPLGVHREIVEDGGGMWLQTERSVTVIYRLIPGVFELPCDISSQFISGLMLALPLLNGDSMIVITTPAQSLPYLHLTRMTMAMFGVECDVSEQLIRVPGRQRYGTNNSVVDGDWSHAALFAVAGTLGEGVEISGLATGRSQADEAIIDAIRRMGGLADMHGDTLRVLGGNLHGADIDVSQCPDLVPALAVLACGAKGITRIINAGRLRYKESDRLAALSRELGELGANIEEGPDNLVISGGGKLRGGKVFCHNDHRVAMALAIASTLCDGAVSLVGAECVSKSAPQFYKEFAALGGIVHGG